ncbi:MAG: D-isomer specific 2-hydroxyacid dehydrogenase [Patescibacteria group bacterium]|nr:D-isomer specific 2-hydroxyacid dehydrogenase [Patescibacteria group bacterium]
MHKIAVFDYRVTPEAQKQISALSSDEVIFPTEIYPETDLIARTGDADIVLISPWDKITKEYLDACPSIKYVNLCGTSTANIDLDELKKRRIAFSNIVSHDKEAVAEFYFMQLVSLARGLEKYKWRSGQRELKGKCIGIIGLGSVGQAIAHLALAYKMRTSYFSPHRKQSWEDLGVEYLEMPELLSKNEIVVVCAPTNVVVLDEAEFSAMKPGSVLVQASGGTPFNKPAFFDWVKRDNNIAIFELSAGERNFQEYKDLPNIVFPRTVAGDTYEANERRAKRIIENLNNYLASVV